MDTHSFKTLTKEFPANKMDREGKHQKDVFLSLIGGAVSNGPPLFQLRCWINAFITHINKTGLKCILDDVY